MKLQDISIDTILDELERRVRANIHDISTEDLVNELASRPGVDAAVVDPYETCRVVTNGPAIILTVVD